MVNPLQNCTCNRKCLFIIGVLTIQTLEEQPLLDEITLKRLMAFLTFSGAGEEKMMKLVEGNYCQSDNWYSCY